MNEKDVVKHDLRGLFKVLGVTDSKFANQVREYVTCGGTYPSSIKHGHGINARLPVLLKNWKGTHTSRKYEYPSEADLDWLEEFVKYLRPDLAIGFSELRVRISRARNPLTVEPRCFARDVDILCAYSTRALGSVSSKSEGGEDALKAFYTVLGIERSRVVTLIPNLNSEVVELSDAVAGSSIEAEGAIVSKPDLYVQVKVGDCPALALLDTVSRTAALVHCGWKQLNDEVCKSIVDKLAKCYGASPRNLIACIGPGIRMESYKFSIDLVQQLHDPRWKAHVACNALQPGDCHIDLNSMLRSQLAELEIMPYNVFCDFTDTRGQEYYSHRSGEIERFAFLVGKRAL